VNAAHSQKVLCFLACGIRTWDSSILGSSAVTFAKSLKADVLVDDRGNSKLSKVIIMLSS